MDRGRALGPDQGLSIGADLWNVEIKNQVLSQGIAEQVGFENPQQYASLFVNPYADPAGFTTIAFAQLPVQRRHGEVSGHRLRRHLLDANGMGRFHRELTAPT